MMYIILVGTGIIEKQISNGSSLKKLVGEAMELRLKTEVLNIKRRTHVRTHAHVCDCQGHHSVSGLPNSESEASSRTHNVCSHRSWH